jgi:hypothetical protein
MYFRMIKLGLFFIQRQRSIAGHTGGLSTHELGDVVSYFFTFYSVLSVFALTVFQTFCCFREIRRFFKDLK